MIGRVVDAFSDPIMGRITDRTRLAGGRRRPWFLIGAIPFGACFALLWVDLPLASETGRFLSYAGIYCLLSLAMTVISVPYYAIAPEMAVGYDERTSLNTYRTVGALIGVFAAVSLPALANALGGNGPGFAAAGVVFGIGMALPWIIVHRGTFERPDFADRPSEMSLLEGMRTVLRHRTFVRLTSIYIVGRIAMDVVGALIILYVTFWLGRPDDFEPVMFLFLTVVLLSLPIWLRIAQGRDKHGVFILGSLWWMLTGLVMVFVQPDSPRYLMFLIVPLIAFGYAVVDLMPWSMVGEVIDEDDLEHGVRREGLYNGFFTFVRKLGGAVGVALVMGILDLAGFVQGEEQTESARQAIRFLTAFAPTVFLGIGVWLSIGYPLTRGAHEQIQRAIDARDRNPGEDDR